MNKESLIKSIINKKKINPTQAGCLYCRECGNTEVSSQPQGYQKGTSAKHA